MTIFRPCIDLHDGKVKQIVGGSLRDTGESPIENFVSDRSAASYARQYMADGLVGGHVIMLGPGNESAAVSAMAAFPNGLQIGGGVNDSNAARWLGEGASHVIVTSWLFDKGGKFRLDRLKSLASKIGKQKLVVDLSCKRTGTGWTVAMNRWQTLTNLVIEESTLNQLSEYCDEFLIHAADVEGLCEGIDEDLVKLMGEWGKIPMTYAGGVASLADAELVATLSAGKVDLTVGSALDIFGGSGLKYDEIVRWSRKNNV